MTYNGRELGEFQPRRTAALVEQGDTHVAQLTVRETLDFSARCQGAGNRAGARHHAVHAERCLGPAASCWDGAMIRGTGPVRGCCAPALLRVRCPAPRAQCAEQGSSSC